MPEILEASSDFAEVLKLVEGLTRWMEESGYAGSFKARQITSEIVDLELYDASGDILDIERRPISNIEALTKSAVEMTRWNMEQERAKKA